MDFRYLGLVYMDYLFFLCKLEKGTNNNKCNKCCNWEIERVKCSEKLVKSVGGHVKKTEK